MAITLFSESTCVVSTRTARGVASLQSMEQPLPRSAIRKTKRQKHSTGINSAENGRSRILSILMFKQRTNPSFTSKTSVPRIQSSKNTISKQSKKRMTSTTKKENVVASGSSSRIRSRHESAVTNGTTVRTTRRRRYNKLLMNLRLRSTDKKDSLVCSEDCDPPLQACKKGSKAKKRGLLRKVSTAKARAVARLCRDSMTTIAPKSLLDFSESGSSSSSSKRSSNDRTRSSNSKTTVCSKSDIGVYDDGLHFETLVRDLAESGDADMRQISPCIFRRGECRPNQCQDVLLSPQNTSAKDDYNVKRNNHDCYNSYETHSSESLKGFENMTTLAECCTVPNLSPTKKKVTIGAVYIENPDNIKELSTPLSSTSSTSKSSSLPILKNGLEKRSSSLSSTSLSSTSSLENEGADQPRTSVLKKSTIQGHDNIVKKKNNNPGLSRWMLRTKLFCIFSDSLFDSIDHDGSGVIDDNDLYHGLTMIHLKLGTFAGAAACISPISRSQCSTLFNAFDRDGSGVLDKIEFREVVLLVFGNVLSRVLVQWLCTLFLAPLMAKTTMQFFAYIANIVLSAVDFFSSFVPDFLLPTFVTAVRNSTLSVYIKSCVPYPGSVLLNMIPNAIWNRVPIMLISAALGLFLLPSIKSKIDSMFQSLAVAKSKKLKHQ